MKASVLSTMVIWGTSIGKGLDMVWLDPYRVLSGCPLYRQHTSATFGVHATHLSFPDQ